MKRRTPLICTAAITVLLACTGGFPPEFPAPDFTLTSPLTGKQVSYSELKDRPVIVYWFTSW